MAICQQPNHKHHKETINPSMRLLIIGKEHIQDESK